MEQVLLFIEYTIDWCKGEIFEARMILLSGVLLLVFAYLFHKFGFTSYSKAIITPLLSIGIFYSSVGIFMEVSNQKRIVQFQKEYEIDREKFIMNEHKRVESFSKWYFYTRILMTLFILIGLSLYFLGGTMKTSWGLVLIFIGFSGFVLDHFSEERAKTYYSYIEKSLKVSNDGN